MNQLGFANEMVAADYRRPTMAEIEAREKNGLTAVGSFSGCGGSSLGLKMAGWRVPYVIEFVDAAADTYQANAPEAYVDRRDIRQIQPEEILDRLELNTGELDLFEGSPPCASFSAAGNREKAWGQTKKYSDKEQRTDDLFFEWTRLLEGLRPKALLAENVPGLLMGGAVEEYCWKITKLLQELGYHVTAKILQAQWYGAPQIRERLIFMGLRKDLYEQAPYPPPATTDPPHTLRQALDAVDEDDPEDVAASSMEKYAVGRSWHLIQDARREGREVDFRFLPCQRCGEPVIPRTHEIVKTTKDGLPTQAKCKDGEKADIAKDYFMLVVPELDEPCPTVTATGAQAGAASVTHPTECRKMTPAELKSVCGFPEDFVLTGSREQRCERMGRAVPPPMYEAVGTRMAEYVSGVRET